ncbi:exoglucanase B [Corallococcus coralloides]|uniref:Exoglucanase B n=2 Tax=Corallococcus coralloides TaxID=184914 RepID=A0A410RNV1_CORCK|nr:exoglucanase B [Corallococcus coralloides]
MGSCGYRTNDVMHRDITSLPAGQDAVVRMTLVPSLAGAFQFQAIVTASETDNVPGNNTRTLTIPVGPATNRVTFEGFDGQVTHVVTNWQGSCSSVTLATSYGWDTNFDNIQLSPLP